ncbi:MAG TPA: proteasome accessory factor PafA2 family protein [Gemmatimonadales bacterium]|jgi:proteasome accessory factor A|nr:proteasome accessory factor PafA2 family protein [Gemmatimonadales bacterium]
MSAVREAPQTVPKLCGADVELGNFIAGVERPAGTGREASRALLRALASVTPVVGAVPDAPSRPLNRMDWARLHLPANGGCAYLDLDHLELCLPEVTSAHDHVAAWHAMLRLAQAALRAANAERPADRRIEALVNNSDGRGNSYGGHLNLLLTRAAWDNLIERKPHHLAYLAAFQASSLLYTGQGKVGRENGAPPARYQLSQRADFIEMLIGPQTTCRRPLVNSRDEPLAGGPLARLHVISFDSTLCQGASLLRVGVLQLILAMLEAGAAELRLALDDPLAALTAWSRDPLLETRADLLDGRAVTAVELQLGFLENARRFGERGGFDGVVPRAGDILALWEDTLELLSRREWSSLTRRLDWVLKLAMLERALRQRPELDWESPELKYLDQLYASLDPGTGLYWAWERAGLVDALVPEERIRQLGEEPPQDTRAWGRAMLLRAGGQAVDRVDWDYVRFRLQERSRTPYRRVSLPDPLGATRADFAPALAEADTLEELLQSLGAAPEPTPPEYLRAKPSHAPLEAGCWWSELSGAHAIVRRKGPGAGETSTNGEEDE